MQLSKEEIAALQETVNTPGYALVKTWFQERERTILDAILKHTMNLKFEEAPKWHAYYSGQEAVIAGYDAWVTEQLNKPFRKQKKPKEDQDE